mgnify:CR=1 FL=1
MAIISTGITFTGAGDTVTASKLNDIANLAEFDDPVDGVSLELDAGKIRIKDAGVTLAKLAPDAIVVGTKAWCSFNGTLTGTNAPLAGSGVTSIQRLSAGYYIVTLSVAAPDANWACFASADNFIAGNTQSTGSFPISTTQARVKVLSGGNGQDEDKISFSAIW